MSKPRIPNLLQISGIVLEVLMITNLDTLKPPNPKHETPLPNPETLNPKPSPRESHTEGTSWWPPRSKWQLHSLAGTQVTGPLSKTRKHTRNLMALT